MGLLCVLGVTMALRAAAYYAGVVVGMAPVAAVMERGFVNGGWGMALAEGCRGKVAFVCSVFATGTALPSCVFK